MLWERVENWARAHWRTTVAGLVAMVLLAPLPAFGIYFLDDWFIGQNQTGRAPSANVSAIDFDNGTSLSVDMGANFDFGRGSSHVVAVRDFAVADGGESMNIARGFQTFLGNGTAQATVTVVPITGGTDPYMTVDRVQAGARPRFFTRNRQRTDFLTGGIYEVQINVDYTKQRNGFWFSASPHVFTLTGI